jgi:hypothetical protein
MHTDRCGNTCRQKCHAKGSRKKKTNIQKFIYTDTMNVQNETYNYNCSHQTSSKRFKEN